MTRFGFHNDASLAVLRELYGKRTGLLSSLQKIYDSALPVLSSLIFNDVGPEMQIDSLKKALEDIDMKIASLIRHEHLNHLQAGLDHFQAHYSDPDKAVFVMMKFPEKNATARDEILSAIYGKIQDTCFRRFGLFAVRADELAAAQTIWHNAQVHALGCLHGIAVLENKYTDEFNPNIAMEAGFMEALGHRVLLLVEETFPHNRADLQGRIWASFTWGDSKDELETIAESITKWFDGLRLPRKPGS